MPKRRIRSAAQIASQRKASLASARVRATGRVISFPTSKAAKYTPPGKGGRRSKMGGKAYTKKSGSGVTIAPAAQQILAGQKVTHSLTDFHPSAVRGEGVVQAGGQLTRNPAARDLGHGSEGVKFGKSPRGGKLAPSLKSVGAKPVSSKKAPHAKKVSPDKVHGSGTGKTAAYRYLKKLK